MYKIISSRTYVHCIHISVSHPGVLFRGTFTASTPVSVSHAFLISKLPELDLPLVPSMVFHSFIYIQLLILLIFTKEMLLLPQILRICLHYDASTESLRFTNGLCVTQEQQQTEGFGPVMSNIISFAASLSQMNCDETEYALLCSISLISGGQ